MKIDFTNREYILSIIEKEIDKEIETQWKKHSIVEIKFDEYLLDEDELHGLADLYENVGWTTKISDTEDFSTLTLF